MKWEAWVLATLVGLSALYIIAKVDAPRKPYTSSDAVWAVVEGAYLVYLIVRLGRA